MSTFVLVHGAWHGGWCWEAVAARLRAAGHRVMTPDLPCHGDDATTPAEIAPVGYVEFLERLIRAEAEPVMLLGHGMAGAAISQTAEACPECIEVLIYLAAYLLRDGESILDVGMSDVESPLLHNLLPYEMQGVLTIRPEAIRELLYGDCDDETAGRALARICPEPIAPMTMPVHVTPGRFGRARRVYIHTERDQTVSAPFQRRMQAALPCDRVLTLDTGHTPFLSAPDALADLLLTV